MSLKKQKQNEQLETKPTRSRLEGVELLQMTTVTRAWYFIFRVFLLLLLYVCPIIYQAIYQQSTNTCR